MCVEWLRVTWPSSQGLWYSSSWSQPNAWRQISRTEPLNPSHPTKVYLFSMSQKFPRCCLCHSSHSSHLFDLKAMHNLIRSPRTTVSRGPTHFVPTHNPTEISSWGSHLYFGFDKESYLYLINRSQTCLFRGNSYVIITSSFQSAILTIKIWQLP